MSVLVFTGKLSVSDDVKLRNSIENVLVSDNYKLKFLEKKDQLSSILVAHYRIS